ncbi:MAG TPA: M23 family metallopeptidase [Nitrospiraceae bacterium]|nr:M23 family metallopeptidase [Nitrospiraceae bacterium]
MDEPKDAYTVMIFRGSMSGPLKFSFSRSLIRKAVGIGVALLIIEAVLLSQTVMRIGEIWELKALRVEMASVREQTTTFSNSVNDLKRRLLAMKEVNQRLRLMLGIEPPKTESILDGKGGDSAPPQGEFQESSNDTSETMQTPQVSVSEDQPHDPLLSRVQAGIAWLQSEAGTEERSLKDLTSAIESKQAKWDATPSIWPVKGWITSGFGKRVSPFTGQMSVHEGVDIGAPFNTPVQSPAAGRVVVTGFDPRMGNLVAIDHGYGMETQYGHMAKVLVKSGQKVRRGDVIGLVGSTGLSTGPHLHYHIKSNSHPVDPQRYILD